jgi:lipoate---protein ligase
VPAPWRIEERVASAGVLHSSWPEADRDAPTRAVAVCRPTGAAVVLGSTQSPDVVDDAAVAAAGLTVVRRRSGGGAVLVTPDDPVWVDVWLPAGDPLWSADVTRAFAWLGRAWADALGSLGLRSVHVQGDGPGACTRWSSLVCFGGVGAGEVTIDGRKAVGLAQRRTRHGAWFHGACVLDWDVAPLLAVLALDGSERSAAAAGLDGAVTGVAGAASAQGLDRAPGADDVVAALLSHLP